jgi:asparagine synthase (glutamine-hydrolysing)
MLDGSKRFSIVYNGEVYNYRQLRSDLESRHGAITWAGGSDTEVILEGVAREGIQFLSKLNGIFALAIYDSLDCILHVVRDPLGIKPLFMTKQGGAAYFCSEIAGIRALPGVHCTLRLEALVEQLAFMYVPEPSTMYREIFKVTPGVCYSFKNGNLIAETDLFAPLSETNFVSEGDLIEALRDQFGRAVKRQLASDVPVSLFLSGGLDSSAVAYAAISAGSDIRTAYTIAHGSADRRADQQGDDLYYAKIIADRLGIKLQIIDADRNILRLIPEIMQFMEDGFTDPAAINTYIIASGARQDGCKVMLTGQGADEYLGGYRRHQAENLLRYMPRSIRSPLSSVLRGVAGVIPNSQNALRRRLSRMSDLSAKDTTERLMAAFTWTSPELLCSLVPEVTSGAYGREFDKIFKDSASCGSLETMMRADQAQELPSLNLCYTDRMTMAVGVEARVPFLDLDLVKLMNSIPTNLKVRGWTGKYIFKKAMEPYLPREVVYRQKAGFGLPIRAWLDHENEMLKFYLDPERLRRQGLFDPRTVRSILEQNRVGAYDHAYTIVTLLCQQIWLDKFSPSVSR